MHFLTFYLLTIVLQLVCVLKAKKKDKTFSKPVLYLTLLFSWNTFAIQRYIDTNRKNRLGCQHVRLNHATSLKKWRASCKSKRKKHAIILTWRGFVVKVNIICYDLSNYKESKTAVLWKSDTLHSKSVI